MKLLPLALVLLTAATAVAQELEFKSITLTKELAGARKGRVVTMTLEAGGAATVQLREPGGKTRSATGVATQVELTRARRAYRAAHVDELPGHIVVLDGPAVDEDAEEGSLRLQSTLPDGRATSCTAELGRYDQYAARIEPIVVALDAIGRRLVSEARAGFQQVTLMTRATGGPTPGAMSSLNVSSTRGARLERRLPGAPVKLAEGEATAAELERVAAALEAVASVPAGPISDARGAESVTQVTVVIVGQDGAPRAITARRGAYGAHPRLAELVDALEAIAKRLASSPSPVGDLGGALGGLGRGLAGGVSGR